MRIGESRIPRYRNHVQVHANASHVDRPAPRGAAGRVARGRVRLVLIPRLRGRSRVRTPGSGCCSPRGRRHPPRLAGVATPGRWSLCWPCCAAGGSPRGPSVRSRRSTRAPPEYLNDPIQRAPGPIVVSLRRAAFRSPSRWCARSTCQGPCGSRHRRIELLVRRAGSQVRGRAVGRLASVGPALDSCLCCSHDWTRVWSRCRRVWRPVAGGTGRAVRRLSWLGGLDTGEDTRLGRDNKSDTCLMVLDNCAGGMPAKSFLDRRDEPGLASESPQVM